jgi:predicted membrane channel-forming protein YqfA (hemolysin III family)
MRVLFLLMGLFVVHRLLVQIYPPYRERFQEFDRKVTWITVILVLYLMGNFVYILFFR